MSIINTSSKNTDLSNEHCNLTDYISDVFLQITNNTTTFEVEEKIYEISSILNKTPNYIIVSNNDGFFIGVIKTTDFLFNKEKPNFEINEIIENNTSVYSDDADLNIVATEVTMNDISHIVVLHQRKAIGIIDGSNLIKLVANEYSDDVVMVGGGAPLKTNYLKTSPFSLFKSRIGWLLLLFIAEAYTGTVLKSFEEQLEAAISLAFFIPLLIGTGGNTGTQITTTMVRAIALGGLKMRDVFPALRKEISAGFLIALAIAAVGTIRAHILGVDNEIIMVVCLTLIAITLWTSFIATLTPLLLTKLKLDPAVVSAPFITTFVDGTGLIIYFEIAKLIVPGVM